MASSFLAGLLLVFPLVLAIAATTPEQLLSRQVDGRFYSNTPFSAPCFTNVNGESQIVDTASCATIQQGYLNESRFFLIIQELVLTKYSC